MRRRGGMVDENRLVRKESVHRVQPTREAENGSKNEQRDGNCTSGSLPQGKVQCPHILYER